MKRIFALAELEKIYKAKVPVTALLGPRQCGKTTLARQFIQNKADVHYFDLEDPTDFERMSDPKLALESLQGLVVIDEVQRKQELFPLLRVLSDRKPLKAKFLILGSASKELVQRSSESLAGRIHYIELTPFQLREIGSPEKHWLRGGFPPSYLAKSLEESYRWRTQYIATFLERDIPQYGINIAALQLRRFWTMLAHYHGQYWNASELSRSLGVHDTTTKRYLDILTHTFMIRQLQPWFTNVKKRLVKSPKIYFRDTGVLHTLLNMKTMQNLKSHPKLGASWEGYALEAVAQTFMQNSNACYFWGVHGQSELDLLIPDGSKFLSFEFKYTSTPRMTKAIYLALEDLDLSHVYIVYPGEKKFPLHKKVTAISLQEVCSR